MSQAPGSFLFSLVRHGGMSLVPEYIKGGSSWFPSSLVTQKAEMGPRGDSLGDRGLGKTQCPCEVGLAGHSFPQMDILGRLDL